MATDQPVPVPDVEDRRRNETWIRSRQKELQIAAGAVALIFAGTLYFGGLNAYLLYHEEPDPFHIAVSQPQGANLAASYRITVQWAPLENALQPVVRPAVKVRRAAVPLASARPTSSDPSLYTGESADLHFMVTSDCTPGVHEGTIHLQKVSGTADAQGTLTSPVRIEVVGGFWTSWFLIRDWLVASSVLLGLLYGFFFLVSYVPSGELAIEHYDGAQLYRANPVRLRRRRLTFLMPWNRPVLPLRMIFEKAGVPACGIAGRIVFKAPRHPVLLLDRGAAGNVFRLGRTTVYQIGRPLPGCGSVEVMWDEDSFIGFAEVRNRPPYLVMRYKAW